MHTSLPVALVLGFLIMLGLGAVCVLRWTQVSVTLCCYLCPYKPAALREQGGKKSGQVLGAGHQGKPSTHAFPP